MPIPATIDAARADLFTAEGELRGKYPQVIVERLLRLRDMYAWSVANPDAKDKRFVETVIDRHRVSRNAAYSDLAIVKALLPALASASRDFHRWRYNEMILETYAMAKKRKDVRTMERAASSYAKYNRVDLEDEQPVPYDLIVVQPFVATSDPSVLGIKPIPNIQKRIDEMIAKYRKETIDIDDVEFEEVDLEEQELFAPSAGKKKEDETASLLQ